SGYGYLTGGGSGAGAAPGMLAVALGMIEHPATAASVIASHGWNLWANTAPDGLVGLAGPAFLLAAPTLLANNLLKTDVFSYPGFQSFAVYGAVALGSIAAVAALARRRAWPLALLLAAAMVANAWGWFDTWMPTNGPQWVRLTAPAASVIESLAGEPGPHDEVVASQGFVGLFAGRSEVYSLSGPLVVPVRARTLWFVFSIVEGQETATPDETLSAIDTVAALPGVQPIVVDNDGIWAYRWQARPGIERLSLGEPGTKIPLFSDPGSAAVADLSGPPSSWMLASNWTTGYLVEGADFEVAPGRYVVSLRLRCDGPVVPEVWDDDDGAMLAGITKGVTALRARVVRMTFTVRALHLPEPPDGSGLFRDQPIPPLPLATIEVRVWDPATSPAEAWWVSLRPVGAASSS
ncbi:MAG TPA: hypothetical protein VMD59_11115, partial [Acidimicrobiales bacterium]|nr:hypothetical protein [Acidimicrobiales bacterium]